MIKKIFPYLGIALAGCANHSEQQHEKPNIIFILADDLGYGDLGCYGQDSFPTPNLDRMAAEGIKFTNHYSGSTVSAPSRCCLMTGLHTGHARVRGNADVPLLPGDTTVAEILKMNGYKTALIGKWGLGEDGSTGIPTKKGFDEFTGYLSQIRAHNAYPDWIWENEDTLKLNNDVILATSSYAKGIGGIAIRKNTHTQDLFTQKAHQFIRRNKDKPFFLYLAYTLPHANNEAALFNQIGMESPDTLLFKNKPWPPAQQAHAGMIASLDKDVGSILNLLQTLEIDEHTLVIFSSDNGPHKEGGAIPEFFDSNGEFSGIKRDLFEGGIRVPLIAWWPGTIESGRVSDHLSAFWDFLPTACEIAGAGTPKFMDGISFFPELTGKEQRKHEYLYWEFFEQGGRTALRKDNWKAIRYDMSNNPNAAIWLFDLSEDNSEMNELSGKYPELIREFDSLFNTARSTSTNFRFDYEKSE